MSLYFDNAATMHPEREMIERYTNLCRQYWWNPSSISQRSMDTRRAIEDTRKKILGYIGGVGDDKIIFTSGGTEANNLAIKGYCCEKSRHLITHYDKDGYYDYQFHTTPIVFTSSIEHPSVINPIDWLYEMGIVEGYNIIPVHSYGCVDLTILESRLKEAAINFDHPIFVSIMLVNNEIGSINPIKEISEIVHKYGGVLHVDAVQAFSRVEINVHQMGIDMMSVSGHKFGAPHGVGFLYVRSGIELSPLLHGGGQEKGLRSGTEDAPSIIIMGEIIDQIYKNFDKDEYNAFKCKMMLWDLLPKNFEVTFNSPIDGVNDITNVTIKGIDNEQLITNLDTFERCYVSAGSACHAGVRKSSDVLQKIGLTLEKINSTIRISMNRNITESEVKQFVAALKRQVDRLKFNMED